MYNKHRNNQFEIYKKARDYFRDNYEQIIALERYCSDYLFALLIKHFDEICADYDEASYLYPFWQNYPPDERGRQPKGDQFPWIEVGEHVLGAKLSRFLVDKFCVRDSGLPTGADQRFVIDNNDIADITKGYTHSCWLFIDIKSVGPRDDQDHTVMSHNQISGDGHWVNAHDGMKNSMMTAVGKRTSHPFHCSLPPLYVLSDGTVAPTILAVVKPVYGMLNIENGGGDEGQPLRRISLVLIPNGLLLEEKPGYMSDYPGLLFPGKDDKDKNPLKVRSRVSFEILRKIAGWRFREIHR